jgi:hypothetical protein
MKIDNPDNPQSYARQQERGQSKFFFIDAPGPLNIKTAPRVATTTVQNFYSYVERGNNRCGLKWSVTTQVNNNQLVRQQVLPYHVPLK